MTMTRTEADRVISAVISATEARRVATHFSEKMRAELLEAFGRHAPFKPPRIKRGDVVHGVDDLAAYDIDGADAFRTPTGTPISGARLLACVTGDFPAVCIDPYDEAAGL